jgi:hypothetical protein
VDPYFAPVCTGYSVAKGILCDVKHIGKACVYPHPHLLHHTLVNTLSRSCASHVIHHIAFSGQSQYFLQVIFITSADSPLPGKWVDLIESRLPTSPAPCDQWDIDNTQYVTHTLVRFCYSVAKGTTMKKVLILSLLCFAIFTIQAALSVFQDKWLSAAVWSLGALCWLGASVYNYRTIRLRRDMQSLRERMPLR